MRNNERIIETDWSLIDRLEAYLEGSLRSSFFLPIKAKILSLFGKPTANASDMPFVELYIYNAEEIKRRKRKPYAYANVVEALKSGRITYWDGRFKGKFSAEISKEFQAMGAVWSGTGFKLSEEAMPPRIRNLIQKLRQSTVEKLRVLEEHLKDMNGSQIAESFVGEGIFEKGLKKIDQKLQEVLKAISVNPDFSDNMRKTLSREWTQNLRFKIRGWADEEIEEMRNFVKGLIFQGTRYSEGGRAGSLEAEIYDRYKTKILATIDPRVQLSRMSDNLEDKVQNKAKFLARNETRLMMTTYQYSKVRENGSDFFQWRCVIGSPNHPVRPSHKKLDRKIFRWDDPPIDEQTNQRVLPGQAYNCRCTAGVYRNIEIAREENGNYKKYADGSYVLA